MIFPSQARKESMALAFAELDKVANPVICEVGRMRNVHAGESDGHSTLVFFNHIMAGEYSGHLVSIDSQAGTQGVAESLGVKGPHVSFFNEDAIEFFREHKVDGIDLLYLDGWDLNGPDSAKQHLLCFMLAERTIKVGGLVLIDDTGYSDLGKGKLIVPVAVLMGWTVLHQGFQTLLRKPS